MSTNLAVYELGEDSEAWLVTSNAEPYRTSIGLDAARVAVIKWLQGCFDESMSEDFYCAVETVLSAEARLSQYQIYSDPQTEVVFYKSPIGSVPVPAGMDRLGEQYVVIGAVRFPDHRTYLKSRQEGEDA